MRRFLVVMTWDAGDEISSAMVGVHADTAQVAEEEALRQAESGELYCKMFDVSKDEAEEIEVLESFAVSMDSVLFIN